MKRLEIIETRERTYRDNAEVSVCMNCRHYETYDLKKMSHHRCHVVENKKSPYGMNRKIVSPLGVCSLWESNAIDHEAIREIT